MKLIIANWKMYLGLKQSVALARRIRVNRNEVVVCPSLAALSEVKRVLRKGVKLGAQNTSWQEGGALTGEVPASMLAELGCKYVIVGHSERRRCLGENNAMVRNKLKAASAAGLIPILCVSKTAELSVLKGLSFNKLVAAYEPIWAIGTGRTPAITDISAMHERIRAGVRGSVKNLRVIYGGSVDERNIKRILAAPGVDGVLVGEASTKLKFWLKADSQ